MGELIDTFNRLVRLVEAHDVEDRDKLVRGLHALYYGGIPTVRRGKSELKRLMREDNAALRRIRDMAVRPECVCGRPTGTAAIRMCAEKALRTPKDDKA